MVKNIHDMSSWGPALNPQRIIEEEQARQSEWEATRQINSTNQWANSQPHGLQQRQVGKQIAGSLWELFAVFDPVDALQQQFEAVNPNFIAIHDVGTQSSRRMLQGLAAATGKPVHQLHIRRQGHGMPIARLEFVELPVADEQPAVRLYTTQIDADTVHRQRLALLLLGYSRLGAVMVGDMATHVMSSALEPMQQAIKDGPWLNRRMLTLPLSKSASVATMMQHVVGRTHIKNTVTPQVVRPAEAWNYLRGSWNNLCDELAQDGLTVPHLMEARAADMGAPAPAPSSSTPQAAPAATPTTAPAARVPQATSPQAAALQSYIDRCAELKGLIACTVFDIAQQRSLVHFAPPSQAAPVATLVAQGLRLLGTVSEVAQTLNMGSGTIDLATTVSGQHLVAKSFNHSPNWGFHALFDRSTNLTLVRLQLQRLDIQLEDALRGSKR
jgi:hypothetical protein